MLEAIETLETWFLQNPRKVKLRLKAGLFGDPVLTLFFEKRCKNVPIVIIVSPAWKWPSSECRNCDVSTTYSSCLLMKWQCRRFAHPCPAGICLVYPRAGARVCCSTYRTAHFHRMSLSNNAERDCTREQKAKDWDRLEKICKGDPVETPKVHTPKLGQADWVTGSISSDLLQYLFWSTVASSCDQLAWCTPTTGNCC